MRKINYISDDSDSESDIVLQVDRIGKEPFTIRSQEFEAIIDAGSPVSILPIDELKESWANTE